MFPKGKEEKLIKLFVQGRGFSWHVSVHSLPGEHTPCSSCPGELDSHCSVNSSIVSQEKSCLSQRTLAVQQHLICERMDNGIMNYPFYAFSRPSTLHFFDEVYNLFFL